MAYPGWYVNRTADAAKSPAWVLEPKQIRGFVRNEPTWMKEDDIHLATYHLKRYIRAR